MKFFLPRPMRLVSFPHKRKSRSDKYWVPDQVGNDNAWGSNKSCIYFLLASFFLFPNLSFAAGVQCSPNGYTVTTINGIFTNQDGAISNRDALKDNLLGTYRGEKLTVDFLPNPSHLGGLGDILKSVYQGIFDTETINDYDLVEMLKSASEKVKTQRILLVAHSQGNFYANSFYDTVGGKADGVPPESIGVYAVATPSSRVAGGGSWLTSDTDNVIAGIVGRGLGRTIMKPNTHIALKPEDDSLGHDFSAIYLKYRSAEIVADIEASLGRLQTNDIRDAQKPCLAPPALTLGHKMQGALFAVADPIASAGNTAVVNAVAPIYRATAAATQMAAALYYFVNTEIAERVAVLKRTSFGMASALYGSSVTLEDLDDSEDTAEPAPAPPLPVLSEMTPPKEEAVAIVSPSVAVLPVAPVPKIAAPPVVVVSDTERDVIPLPESAHEATSTPATETAPSTVSSLSAPSGGSWGPERAPAVPAPVVSFSVRECSNSLASAGCLTASTTLALAWVSSASNLSYFTITCTVNGSACTGFTFSNTTATSTAYTVPDDTATYTFTAIAVASDSQQSNQAEQSVEVASRPLVINEIAWAGTSASRSADEWIEVHNPTGKTISLSGWVLRSSDNSPYIPLSGSIAAGGYFLLERTNDDPVSDIIASQTYTGPLNNTAEQLILSYASTTMDQSPATNACGSSWCFGETGSYKTMERFNPTASGTDIANWDTFATLLPNGTNADGIAIAGTPSRRNSISYYPSLATLTQHTTLTVARSPYIVTSTFTVPAGITLSIDPGVIIKMYGATSAMTINGALMAGGTVASPVIVTSFKDDTYAGDTNADASATTPAPGDWGSVKIASTAASSTLSHVVVRFGGVEDAQTQHTANLRIENASTTVSNSIIEKSHTYGIRLNQAAGGVIENNTIRENNRNISGQTTGIGILMEQSSPTIANNTITQNTHGLWIYTASNPAITNNAFTQNTLNAIEVSNSYPTFSQNTAVQNGTNGIAIGGTQTQDYAFSTDVPYLPSGYTIAENTTLTLPAGAVMKSPRAFTVRGRLVSQGTAAHPVIITSLKDDTAGGDTNADGSATTHAASDWTYLSFIQNQATSTLTYTTVRYGGNRTAVSQPYEGALRIEHASPEIRNSTIAYNGPYGIWMSHSTSTIITDSIIEEHRDATSETLYGIFLTASSTPTLSNTIFRNNEQNIFADGTSTTTDGGGNGW